MDFISAISGDWEIGRPGVLNWHFAGMWFLVINGLTYLIYGFVSGRFLEKLLPIRPADVVHTVVDTLHLKIAHAGPPKGSPRQRTAAP